MVIKVEKPSDPAGLTLEAWAQGMMFGSLVIMAAITVANMRRKVLLHKLILIEVSPISSYTCDSILYPIESKDFSVLVDFSHL